MSSGVTDANSDSGTEKQEISTSKMKQSPEHMNVQEIVSLIERNKGREGESSASPHASRDTEDNGRSEASCVRDEKGASGGTVVRRKPSRCPPEPPSMEEYTKPQWTAGRETNICSGNEASYSSKPMSGASGESGPVYATVLTLTGRAMDPVVGSTSRHRNGDDSSRELNSNIDTVDVSPSRARFTSKEGALFSPVVMRKKIQVSNGSQASGPLVGDYLEIYKCTNSPLKSKKNDTGRVTPLDDDIVSRSKMKEPESLASKSNGKVKASSDDRLYSNENRSDSQSPYEHNRVERTFTYTIERESSGEDTMSNGQQDDSREVIHSSSQCSSPLVPQIVERNPIPAKRGLQNNPVNSNFKASLVASRDEQVESFGHKETGDGTRPGKSRGKWATKNLDETQLPAPTEIPFDSLASKKGKSKKKAKLPHKLGEYVQLANENAKGDHKIFVERNNEIVQIESRKNDQLDDEYKNVEVPSTKKQNRGFFNGWFSRSNSKTSATSETERKEEKSETRVEEDASRVKRDAKQDAINHQSSMERGKGAKDGKKETPASGLDASTGAPKTKRSADNATKKEAKKKVGVEWKEKANERMVDEIDALGGLCPSISIAVGKNAIATHDRACSPHHQITTRETTIRKINAACQSEKGYPKRTRYAKESPRTRRDKNYMKLLPLESIEREEEEDSRNVPSPGGRDARVPGSPEAGRDYEYDAEEVDENTFYQLDPKMYSAKKNIAQGPPSISSMPSPSSPLMKGVHSIDSPDKEVAMSPVASFDDASSSVPTLSSLHTSTNGGEMTQNILTSTATSIMETMSSVSTWATSTGGEMEESSSHGQSILTTGHSAISSLVTSAVGLNEDASSTSQSLISADGLSSSSRLVVDATEGAVSREWSLGILHHLPPSTDLPFYFYWISVSMIVISIAMQVVLGILLLFNSRHLDLTTARRSGKRAEYCNHFILLIILIITILNILIGVLIDFPFGHCNNSSSRLSG